MKTALLVAALALTATAALAQSPAPTATIAVPARPAVIPPPPTPMKGVPLPASFAGMKINGSGITVDNIDGMRDWYVTTLGMKLTKTYNSGPNGAVNEYILAFPSDLNGPIVALLKGRRSEGATTYGRLILRVPDSTALANHLTSNGVNARKVADGAYFIRDPEGNNIELYTPPVPAK
jgi:catechol 2,3-dioxygenase-like lactoylglutathione lyase family enzyme